MTGWAVIEAEGATLLHRPGRAPAWDVAVERVLPGDGSARVRRRLAHQVRQDVWRAARGVRGFVPAIRVASGAGGLTLRAGGDLLAGPGPGLAARIAAVLDAPANRARWLAHARRGRP